MFNQIGRLIVGLAVALLVLTACGNDKDTPPPVTATPRPSATWAPTWTPAPTNTLLPTRTPAPTSTSSIQDPTYAPALVTGLREMGDELLVTIRQDDLNVAVADAYRATVIPDASNPPEVALEINSQMSLTLQFTNPFLDEAGKVIARTQLSYTGNRLTLMELPERRKTSGAEVTYEGIWAGIAVAETGLNTIVFDVLGEEVNTADWTIAHIQVYQASHVEVYFAEKPHN